MVSWGLVSAATAFVNGPTMFYVLRFLLGVAEAGFFPAIIFYFSRWLPGSHRGRATAMFVAGSSIAAAVSGPVSGPLLALDGVGGAAGWQWLFGLEGLLSVVVGCIAYRLLDSRIEDARWLTRAEQRALADTVEREDDVRRAEAGAEAGTVSRWKLLLNPQVLVFCGIYFAIQLSIYANTFWLPGIVRRIDGVNDITVGLLSSLPWICAVIATYLAGRASDRLGRSKPLLVAALLVAAAGTYLAAITSPALALVFLCVAAMGFKSASPLFWTIPQGTMHPAVLAPAIALVNSLGNLGGFVAPYGFGLIKEATGQVTYGLYALALSSVAGAALVLLIRRDRSPAAPEPGAAVPPAPSASPRPAA